MTQKEITTAKKKARKCLDLCGIKIPMVKMSNVSYSERDNGWSVLFIDIRTKDIYYCSHYSNVYYVFFRDYNSGKKTSYIRKDFEND